MEFFIINKIKNIFFVKKNNIYIKISFLNKILFLLIIINILLIFQFQTYAFQKKDEDFFKTKNQEQNILFKQDNLTLVTCFYMIGDNSKHSLIGYFNWMGKFLKLNKSIVIFTEKSFLQIIKQLRPKNLHYRTKFIELEIKDFYAYNKYGKIFKNTYKLEFDNRLNIPLYLIYGEKCAFLKRAIENNYFNSTCFYWIDIGYFRKYNESMQNYTNSWPSLKRCYEDPRVLINLLRKFTEVEINGLLEFNLTWHKRLQRRISTAGGMFGGKAENLLKFIDLYYKSIILFSNHNIYMGKDQNIFTFVGFSHPEVVRFVYTKGDYYYFKKYLS